MTNLDVLSGLGEVSLGVAYTRGGERWDAYPAHLAALDGIEVEYEQLPGWGEDLTGVRTYEALPARAREFVERTEQRVGVPIRMLSVGPERDQVISRGL